PQHAVDRGAEVLVAGPVRGATPGGIHRSVAYHLVVTETSQPAAAEASGDPDLVSVLAGAARWPSATASLAVVRPERVVASWGPTSHRFALASVTKLFA